MSAPKSVVHAALLMALLPAAFADEFIGGRGSDGWTTVSSGTGSAAPGSGDARHRGDANDRRLFSPSPPSFLFILVDDVGYSDFSYAGGNALTPNIDAWISRPGTVRLNDMHSGGTVCSPTRATVLTGRHHFRDCVDYVYGCSDMTECVPDFEFAPMRTFTVGDAVRAATADVGIGGGTGNYGDGGAFFAGKWHLGSFYNDSSAYGGLTSSPVTHGFHHFNATVGVVPTATANCQCRPEWTDACEFGHYNGSNHCKPTDKDCCFNYWWDDPLSPHSVSNLTWPSSEDDATYLADAFSRFLADRRRRTSTTSPSSGGSVRGQGGREKDGRAAGGPPDPFLAQISFHNCHIPFIGSRTIKESCSRNETCRPPRDADGPYTETELDYYACLIELDSAVGSVLDALEREGYYDNTMIWFASDNGPEMNCPPAGICERADDRPHRPVEGPGSAGPLRGRKRDIYEGGHRVPGAISWPAFVGGENLTSLETVSTMDFLPTVMDVLDVDRPPEQADWAMDGRSVLSILRGGRWEDTDGGPRSMGIGYYDPSLALANGWGYRRGRWKYVEGSASCREESCRRPQLFDLEEDLGERTDLSEERPEVLEAMKRDFTEWHNSMMRSRVQESNCRGAIGLMPPPSLWGDGVGAGEGRIDKEKSVA